MFAVLSTLFAVVFGAIIGSFLNVVIHRVPLGASVVVPGSHCPQCDYKIKWYDNIPVFSWLVLLDGKCRQCKTPISIRYTLVEALMGILAGGLWIKLIDPYMHYNKMQMFAELPNLMGLFALYFTFVALLISIAFIDLEHFIIPHGLSVPGILLGLASPWVVGSLLYAPEHILKLWPPVSPMTSLIGAIAGALSIIGIFVLYFMARGIPGMGGGDVMLMAMAGAWLGWPALIFIFFAASIQGLIAAGVSTLFGLELAKSADELFEEDELHAASEAEESATSESSEDSLVADSSGEEPAQTEPEPEEELGEPSDLSEETKDETLEAASVESPVEDSAEVIIEATILNEEDTTEEEDLEEDEEASPMAIPFGPFIVLSALEFFFLGTFLPPSLSLVYLYGF